LSTIFFDSQQQSLPVDKWNEKKMEVAAEQQATHIFVKK
jgi:hypothetical protein